MNDWDRFDEIELAEAEGRKPSFFPKVFVSLSGGKTSGFLARQAQLELEDTHNIIYVFANTGMEDDATLEFIHKMDVAWGLGVVWLEAKINKENGKGTRYRVVDYETATRWKDWKNNSNYPFYQMAMTYGVPNQARPHCTRELKLAPMYSYVNELWGAGNYQVFVGIRNDETDRVDPKAHLKNIRYPLVERSIDKAEINEWWSQQDFNLPILEHRGNCLMCWKKSTGKLGLVNRETPGVFDFARSIEAKSANNATRQLIFRSREDRAAFTKTPQKMYRGWLNTDEMLRESEKYDLDSIEHQLRNMPSESSGCTESCEAFGCSDGMEAQQVEMPTPDALRKIDGLKKLRRMHQGEAL